MKAAMERRKRRIELSQEIAEIDDEEKLEQLKTEYDKLLSKGKGITKHF